MNKSELLHVSPDECTPAPWFNRTDLNLTPEFLADVKKNGVRQSLLVRKLPLLKSARHLYEIVAGSRRHAAALKGGVDKIPVLVADLTDQQAREARLTENLQRDNLNALDESRQMKEALATGQYGTGSKGVEALAVALGKGRSHVYGRLRLNQLGPAVLDAVKAGKISASIAELLATLPGQQLQEQALKKVLEGGRSEYDPDDEWADDQAVEKSGAKGWKERTKVVNAEQDRRLEPMSFRAVKAMLNSDFRLDLKEDARWKLDDAKLLPAAGACTTCPKRSGTTPDLFPEIKNPNLCTDPDCFNAKRALCDAAALKKHIEAGHQVMTPEEHKKAFAGHYGVGGPWATAGEYNYKINGSWRDKLGKALPVPTYAVDNDGKVGAFYRKSELVAAAQAKGLLKDDDKPGKPPKAETPEQKAKREAAEAAAKLEEQITEQKTWGALEAVLKPIQAGKHLLEAVRFVFDRFDDSDGVNHKLICQRRGWENLIEHARKLSGPELLALLVESFISESYDDEYNEQAIQQLAKHLDIKIDWKGIEKGVRARLTPAKTEAAPAKAAKPAKVKTKAKK